MKPAQAQQQVDAAVQVLLEAVRAAYPMDAAVTVKAGQGSYAGKVCGEAQICGHEIKVQVQHDHDPRNPRSKPRWHYYRNLSRL